MTHYDSSCAQKKVLKNESNIFSFHCPINTLSLHQTISSISFILQITQHQDQLLNPLKMNMSRAEQQVITYPASSNNTKSVLKRKKTNGFTSKDRDQSKLRLKLTETVKRKLSLGAKILQVGGLEKIYKRFFRVNEDEKLFKTYQCYLSTTAGPIAGLLFISSKKMSFCSERSIKVASPQGDMIRVHYKVSVPLCKIKRVNHEETVTEVHGSSHGRWFRILVHGVLKLQESFQLP